MTRIQYIQLLFFAMLVVSGYGQEQGNSGSTDFATAYALAQEGEHGAAQELLSVMNADNPRNTQVLLLLAKVHSWTGDYNTARGEFNRITSKEKKNRGVWISAIKNELYAGEENIALGLANKALTYLPKDKEVERLKAIALNRIKHREYPQFVEQDVKQTKGSSPEKKAIQQQREVVRERQELPNRLNLSNSVTVFDDRYDPMVFSSISYRYLTPIGSVIPRINYSNRLGQSGVQYDLDFYPRFLKRFYAYINYGYSNAQIYPNHKVGGDIYMNLPKGIEFSAGGRFIKTNTRDITAITNSAGYYTGNYYFSLRSYITPRPDRLTRFSANLLIRKYGKDAENFKGISIGMGVSPELRQFIVDNQLLAETIFFTESQRLNLVYQFTGKKTDNGCRINIGIRRQEVAFDSGNFFWAFNTGLTYQIKI